LDGCAICGFRSDRLSGHPQQHPRIVVGVRVVRIDGEVAVVKDDLTAWPGKTDGLAQESSGVGNMADDSVSQH
jgi:hypothetical protein